MLAALLVLAQELEPLPSLPYDRVEELELFADDPELVEGWGPTAIVEYEVEFDGTLNVWAESELDLFVQLDDALEGRRLHGDDDSGGGTTPYLGWEVEEGQRLAVLVAAKPGESGEATLHLVAAPESEETRAAADALWRAVAAARQDRARGEYDAARAGLEQALKTAEGAAGAAHSRSVYEVFFEIGPFLDSEFALASMEKPVMEHASRFAGHALPPRHIERLMCMGNLGTLKESEADYAGARDLYRRLVVLYEETHPAGLGLISALVNLGWAESECGNYEAAERALRRALAECDARVAPEHEARITVLQNLARLHATLGELDRALAIREEIVLVRGRFLPPDDSRLLVSKYALASSLRRTGDLPRALALVQEVLAIRERTLPADHVDLLTTRSLVGAVMVSLGDALGAVALLEGVVADFERTTPEHHVDHVVARQRLAQALRALGREEEASAQVERTLAAMQVASSPTKLNVLVARMNAALVQPDAATQRAELEDVVALFEEHFDPAQSNVRLARMNLALSLRRQGEREAGRALGVRAWDDWQGTVAAGDPERLYMLRWLLLWAMQDGLDEEARVRWRQLVDETAIYLASAVGLAPRSAQEAALEQAGQLGHVLWLAEPGSADERRALEIVALLRSVTARRGPAPDGDGSTADLRARIADVRAELGDLVSRVARDGASDEAARAEVARLSLERDRLEGRLRRLTEPDEQRVAIDFDALATQLGTTDLWVGYQRYRPLEVRGPDVVKLPTRLLAYALAADGAWQTFDLGLASEVEELATSWREALGAPIGRGVEIADADGEVEAGTRLRERVLDPIVAWRADVERVLVQVDGALNLVPLDALPLDDGATRLGDRVRIANEVSAERLLVVEAAPADEARSLLALGGVDYDADGSPPQGLPVAVAAPIDRPDAIETTDAADAPPEGEQEAAATTRAALPDRFRRLLQTRYEAETVAGLFEETFETEPVLVTRGEATKAALFAAAPGKRYVHLATHGWFAPESVASLGDEPAEAGASSGATSNGVVGLAPMTLCGLALAGANRGRDSVGRVPGILTAEELCALDLSACELAVLSACETNVGVQRAGQSIQSLQTALHAAGARTSITSLWVVDDAATRQLMELFYTNLWIEGMDTADALWAAKRALRDDGAPVRDWAGWVLTGGW